MNALIGLFRSALHCGVRPQFRQPTTAGPPGVNSWEARPGPERAEATGHMILAPPEYSTLAFMDHPKGWHGRVAAGSGRVARVEARVVLLR